MMDRDLLEHLEGYLTERRKGLFTKVLAQRTRHFTVAVEDVYQMHNTSAVLRSCDVFGIQDVHVIEASLGKNLLFSYDFIKNSHKALEKPCHFC